MTNPRNPDSIRPKFEQRVEKIQNEIKRFIKDNESGRSEIQIWDNNEPSTSSSTKLKKARHHFIPGEKFRDAFLNMLSNRRNWPNMVQMLNAALDNFRHHGSGRKIHVPTAQNALNMFDARIPDCDFDMDSFYEALEYLYALFYWSPFNINFGPLPYLRAPADAGNKLDKALTPNMDFITAILCEVLEKGFEEIEISESFVKLYIVLLLSKPTPVSSGCYKEILPTFDRFVDNYIQNDLEIKPRTEEYDQVLLKMKNGEIVEKNGITVHVIHLEMLWMLELKKVGACDGCKKNAYDSCTFDPVTETLKNYKCQAKKCPFFSGIPKYALHSNVHGESVMVMLKIAAELLASFSIVTLFQLLKNIRNEDSNCYEMTETATNSIIRQQLQQPNINEDSNCGEVIETATNPIIRQQLQQPNINEDSNCGEVTETATISIIRQQLQQPNIIEDTNPYDLRNRLKSSEYAMFYEFLFLTENLDYEYKKIKDIMKNKPMYKNM